jgi:hypothetical protein
MEIYIAKSGKEAGPFTKEGIASMLDSGMVTLTDLVWHKDLPDWIPVHEFLKDRPPSVQARMPSVAGLGRRLVMGAIGLFLIVMILRMNLPTVAEIQILYPLPTHHKESSLEKLAVWLGDEPFDPELLPPWEITDLIILEYADNPKVGVFGTKLIGLPFCKWRKCAFGSYF